jgi:Na+/H+-translocating membrane pyrophosphatase
VKISKCSIVFLVSFLAPASTVFASQTVESATATGIPTEWLIAPLASVAALVVAYIFYRKMMAAPEGNEKMVDIAGHVREGAYAYLFSQYKVVAFVFGILFVVFTALAYLGVQNPFVPPSVAFWV